MPRNSLTDAGVRAAKPPVSGTRTFWDANLRSFGLRVSQGGTKTFFVMVGKDRTRLRIGHYPHWTVKDARAEALRLLADRAGKPSPKRVRFEDAFEAFKEKKLPTYRPRVGRETQRTIEKHLMPKFGKRALQDISTNDVLSIVDGLSKTPGTAEHVFKAARLIFRWALKRRMIDRSPLEAVDVPIRTGTRSRVLLDSELAAVWRKAVANDFTGGKITRLLILTGQRRGEIGAIRGEWFDRGNRLITLPGSLTKNRRDHTFPYGDMVAEIIKDLPDKGLLFPARGRDGEKPYCGWSKLKEIVDPGGIPQWQFHDLRRNYATNLAALKVPPHIIERFLNHVTGQISGVAAIYNHYLYLDEMRDAVQRHEIWLQALLSKQEDNDGRRELCNVHAA